MIASLHFAKAFTIRHDTLLIFYCVRRVMTSLTLRPLPSSFVVISPSPWERDGVRILFLSPRNPVFNIFSLVVLSY